MQNNLINVEVFCFDLENKISISFICVLAKRMLLRRDNSEPNRKNTRSLIFMHVFSTHKPLTSFNTFLGPHQTNYSLIQQLKVFSQKL